MRGESGISGSGRCDQRIFAGRDIAQQYAGPGSGKVEKATDGSRMAQKAWNG